MQLPPMRPRRFRHRTRKEPESGGDTVVGLLEGLGLTDYAQSLRIQIAWREAVGAEIADRTAPASFSRGTLVVRVKNASWQNELTFLKAEIIARLNQALGKMAVKDLKIQAGHVPSRAERGTPAWATAPLAAEQARQVEAAASAIADPEVRRAFSAAMGLYSKATKRK